MIQHLFGQQEIDTAESSCQLGKTNMSFLLIALVLRTANEMHCTTVREKRE
jgi:hypothetical protein